MAQRTPLRMPPIDYLMMMMKKGNQGTGACREDRLETKGQMGNGERHSGRRLRGLVRCGESSSFDYVKHSGKGRRWRRKIKCWGRRLWSLDREDGMFNIVTEDEGKVRRCGLRSLDWNR